MLFMRFMHAFIALCCTVGYVSISGCDAEVVLPNQQVQNAISVQCVLYRGEPLTVSVGAVTTFGAATSFRLDDAVIKLYENEILLRTIDSRFLHLPNYSADFPLDNTNSVYLDTLPFYPNDQAVYRISVEHQGYPMAISQPVVYNKVLSQEASFTINYVMDGTNLTRVDSLYYEVDADASGVLVSDVFNIEFLQLLDRTSNPRYENPYLLPIISSPLATVVSIGRYHAITRFENYTFRPDFDSVPRCAILTHQTADFLNYARAYTEQNYIREELGGPRIVSAPLPNNINNGYGWFAVLDAMTLCDE